MASSLRVAGCRFLVAVHKPARRSLAPDANAADLDRKNDAGP
jgi:hypothetical protein